MVNPPAVLVRSAEGVVDVIAVEGFKSEHEIASIIVTWMAEVDVGALGGVWLRQQRGGRTSGTRRIDGGSIVSRGRRAKDGRSESSHFSER